MGLGATWWFYRVHGRGVLYLLRRWEWRRGGPCSPTIRHFHNQDRQQHFSVIIIVTIIILREGTFIHRHFKEISEICYIHTYTYTLSYLQYIQIYTNIYIPTYRYIQICSVFLFFGLCDRENTFLLRECECDVKFWYELGSIELDLELKPILAVYGIKM